ncbi:MAG: hypothetical protein K6G90_03380 [Clostridia bacterium]|nr:hypothetical protein [Clostridia bacterium]
MKTKQLISLCMAFLLIASLFAACTKTDDGETTTDAAESIVIDLNRVVGNGEEESRTVRIYNTAGTEATSASAVPTTAEATSATVSESSTALTTTTAPASTTAAPTTAASSTAAPTTAAPTTTAPTTAAPTTKAPETTTAKTLSAVQTAWKNISSANRYVSSNELLNALEATNTLYNTAKAQGCTNLKPGSVYTYGDNASANIIVYTALDPEEIIYEVDIKDNTYSTPEGLSVGDSVQSARQLYGTPDVNNQDMLIYNQDKPYCMMISVNSNGVITGISLRAKDD